MNQLQLILVFLLCFGANFFASSAYAQEQKAKVVQGKDIVKYKKKTVLEFAGSDVDGELVKPEGSQSMVRGRSQFGSLINIRSQFVSEMWKNARKL